MYASLNDQKSTQFSIWKIYELSSYGSCFEFIFFNSCAVTKWLSENQLTYSRGWTDLMIVSLLRIEKYKLKITQESGLVDTSHNEW